MASIWEYANPVKFIRTTDRVLPWLSAAAVVALVGGLFWGFFLTPDDYRQGSTVKIIYLHVPAALMAINAWLMMLVASLIWIVRRHHVSALAARAAAPVGAVMTLIALATGAIWGQPMWGTWWAWDPRLTSFLVLFLFYLGYMALWSAIENDDTAADLTSILCLVGSVFAVLSARVGSIGDNRIGGWISYRAAKAAVNQIVHTAAIELARTHKEAACVALHPGTVATEFTQKYLGRHPSVPPEEAAENLLRVIEGLGPEQTGLFFDWAGKRVEW